ncbi:MAG: CBS domain-containing protein [Candidatus Izemoplasmatales bacterium]|nr:CBS domain-containing protein [Candidatus Izemoplasmatales bacterium]
MDLKETFLSTFNEIESYLRIEYNDGRFSESSFMGTLFRIRGKKTNPIIAQRDHFETLSQAAQLRNLMVHNDDVAMPTPEFLQKFQDTVNRIVHPKRVEEVMQPIRKMKTATLDWTVEAMIQMMKEHGYSNIPVVENHRLKGVFTERTLTHYFMLTDHSDTITKSMTCADLIDAMDLDDDPTRYFDFIPRDFNLDEALAAFGRDLEEDKELEILFVTEHGLKSEAILGIVTIWDLKQAFLGGE